MLIADSDHIGNLPYLNSDNGFKGKIFGTYKTIEGGMMLTMRLFLCGSFSHKIAPTS